jgi:iron complex transport system ATP-binding protein
VSTPLPLEAHGIAVDLGGRRVLSEVDLELRDGELLAVVGPNGSGKTTLLRTLLGLQVPAEGDVKILGQRARALSPTARARRAAWMPQEERPSENLTVQEYVGLARFPHIGAFGLEDPSDRRAVEDALVACDLGAFRDRGVLDLSGGERQRVLFARALAQAAPVLVLDEPTSHLDMARQFETMAYLDRFRRAAAGRAVLVAMHDLNLASRYANRLLWLARGKVAAVDTPRASITAERIYQVFGIETVVQNRDGQVVVFPPRPAPEPPRSTHGGRRVHVICGGGSGEDLLPALVGAGHSVSAGALHLLDSDAVLARELHVSVTVEAPFSDLSEPIRSENRQLMAGSDAIVVAPLCIGPANLPNLEDVLAIAEGREIFLLEGPPRSDRDFTGGAGVRALQQLEGRGAVVVSGVPDLLARLRDASRSSRDAGSGGDAPD